MLMDRIPCSVLLCDDNWMDDLVLSVRTSANASGWEPSWGVKLCCQNGAGGGRVQHSFLRGSGSLLQLPFLRQHCHCFSAQVVGGQ